MQVSGRECGVCAAQPKEVNWVAPRLTVGSLLAHLLESQTVAQGAGLHPATEQNWVKGIGA